MARIILRNLADTALLAQCLAKNAAVGSAFFLRGPLGCGKTTLVRLMVDFLPGGKEAEVSSPTFSIYNIYPTLVPVIHADLYRCQGSFPEELLTLAQDGLIVVEWAEFFKPRPPSFLDIWFELDKNIRSANITGHGRERKLEKEILSLPGLACSEVM